MEDLWWMVLSPEDPANGAEPAKWDGDRARDGTKDDFIHDDYILSNQEDVVLQEGWEEQATVS